MDNKNYRNNLKNETSPYLLQHADNPVDWYPWNKESLELSKKLDKPIFLSIGYSTCHWCHVMAHESFENEETAKVMNELFVNIKVDKEERPDIDKVYMQYLHATKQGGGWPMSIWLTPESTPIIGGTYFPPTAKYGRHGFADICKLISNAWNKEKKEILLSSQNTIDQMKELFLTTRAHNDETTFDQIDLEQTCEKLVGYFLSSFDGEEGGFGNAPKFPRVSLFESIFQLAEFSKKHNIEGIDSVLNAAFFTLRKMALGGMNDQLSPISLSGSHGFHRYSVDKFFHVPHYEKMMYDQAQLLSAYTSAYKISLERGNKEIADHFKNVVIGILNYISSEMTQKETGAVYTAEDADSLPDHESNHPTEGAYYVWEYGEVSKILDNETDFNIFSKFYGLKKEGNSPPGSDPHEELVNKNTLKQFYTVQQLSEEINIPEEQIVKSLENSKKKLFEIRQKRPKCFKDTKILCYLNAMTACSLVYASNMFGLKQHLDHAVKIFQFISKNFYCEESKILYRNISESKERRIEGFSDDYAWTVKLSLDLYERLGDFSYLKFAIDVQQKQFQLFYDIDNNGGFYDNHGNDKTVLMRVKEEYDGAEPSSSSVSLLNISRLYKITKDPFYKEKLESSFLLFRRNLEELPNSLPYMCKALLHYSQKQTEIVLIGNPLSPPAVSSLDKIHSTLPFLNKTLLFSDGGEGHLFLEKFNEVLQHVSFRDQFVRVMVCDGLTCRMPLDSDKDVEWKELESQLLDLN